MKIIGILTGFVVAAVLASCGSDNRIVGDLSLAVATKVKLKDSRQADLNPGTYRAQFHIKPFTDGIHFEISKGGQSYSGLIGSPKNTFVGGMRSFYGTKQFDLSPAETGQSFGIRGSIYTQESRRTEDSGSQPCSEDGYRYSRYTDIVKMRSVLEFDLVSPAGSILGSFTGKTGYTRPWEDEQRPDDC